VRAANGVWDRARRLAVGGWHPDVDVAPNGQVHVVFNGNGLCCAATWVEVFYMRSDDGGATWQAPAQLTFDTVWTGAAVGATDAWGGYHLAYLIRSAYEGDMYHRYRRADGSWTQPELVFQAIMTGQTGYESPALEADGTGNLIGLFSCAVPGQPNSVCLRARTWQGRWFDARRLSIFGATAPSLAGGTFNIADIDAVWSTNGYLIYRIIDDIAWPATPTPTPTPTPPVSISISPSSESPNIGSQVTFMVTITNSSSNPIPVQSLRFGPLDGEFGPDGNGLTFTSFPSTNPSSFLYPPVVNPESHNVTWTNFAVALDAAETTQRGIIARVDRSGTHVLTATVVLTDGQQFTQDYALQVPITRIDFTDPRLRSMIFWAIFHETSEDEYFSGYAGDNLNPLYGIDPSINPNLDPRQLTQFLTISPYCDPTPNPSDPLNLIGGNSFPDEQLDQGWDSNIVAISHCNPPDHRAFYVHAIINNLISTERRIGANRVLEYFDGGHFEDTGLGWGSWSESFGDRSAPIWQEYQLCDYPNHDSAFYDNSYPALPYATYELAYRAAREASDFYSRELVLDWVHAYLQCQRLNTSDNPNQIARRTYLQNAYVNIMREIEIATASTASLAYDPTGGVTLMMAPNDPSGTEYGVTAGVPETITQNDVDAAYSQHMDIVRNNYEPGYPTILRPVLRAELFDSPDDNVTYYDFTAYTWESFVFQRGQPGFRR
jgi:hypothetical protein